MNKKIVAISSSVICTLAPVIAFAQAAAAVGCGGGVVPGPITNALTGIASAALAIGAGIAVVGFVVAGVMYLTSAGGSKMETAKKALIAAVVGSAIVAISGGANILQGIICAILNLK